MENREIDEKTANNSVRDRYIAPYLPIVGETRQWYAGRDLYAVPTSSLCRFWYKLQIKRYPADRDLIHTVQKNGRYPTTVVCTPLYIFRKFVSSRMDLGESNESNIVHEPISGCPCIGTVKLIDIVKDNSD
jgi:hypothetical protein